MQSTKSITGRFWNQKNPGMIEVEIAVAELTEGNPEPEMIDLCREAYPKLLKQARGQAGGEADALILRSLGKSGDRTPHHFLASYGDSVEDGLYADTVEAVDSEDAEFQAFFVMAQKALTIEEDVGEFFNQMESMCMIELDNRPELTEVLNVLEKLTATIKEDAPDHAAAQEAQSILQAYGRKIPDLSSSPSP